MKKIQRLIMFACMFTIVGIGQAFGQDPAIICPSDITLSNDQDYTDTDITGLATAFDINGEVGVEFTDIIINLDANNDGFVRRRFNVVDRTDIFCDQTITVGNPISSISCNANIVASLTGSPNNTTPSKAKVYAQSFIYNDEDFTDLKVSRDGVYYSAFVEFYCCDIGVQPFYVQATNNEGDIETCNGVILIEDKLAPVINDSWPIYLSLYDESSVELTVDMLYISGYDNCGIESATFSQSVFTTMGEYEVDYTISDASGNSSSGVITVIVSSPFENVITCNNNINVSLDNEGNAYITPDMLLEGIIFANANYTVSINDGPFNKQVMLSCSDHGTVNQITVRDENSGNECWSNVIIQDKLPPVLNIPDPVYLSLNVPTEALLTTEMLDRFTFDNCGIVSKTLSNGQFNTDGTYIVSYTVADEAGNTTTQDFQVIVNFGPTSLACTESNEIILGDDGTATVDYQTQLEQNYLNLNFKVSLYYYDNPNENNDELFESITLDCSHVGQNIGIQVHDPSTGNSCYGAIEVLDKKAPTPYAQSVISVSMNGAEPYVLNPALVDLGSFDNCDGDLSMTVTPNTFYAPGTYMVKLRVYDESGNSDFAMSTLIIEQGGGDPSIQCINLSTAVLDQFGPTTLYAVDFLLNPDDFESVTMSTGPNGPYTETIDFDCAQYDMNEPFNIYVQGTNDGETSTCVVSLTLIDNTPPVAVTDQGITLQLQNCQAILLPQSVDDGSYDLCGEVTLSLSQTLFTSSDIGENEVTLTVTDASGNTNQGVTIITVVGNNDDCNDCTVNDVFFPSDITITDENGVLENLSVENLQSVYNYSYEQVYPFTTAQCEDIAYAYEDQIFNTVDGYKILRTFTALDWLTNSIKSMTQTIQLYTETNSVLVCNSLVQINVENGNYQVLPEYVLEGGNYNFSSIILTIEDQDGNIVANNIITPNYIGQILNYSVTDTSSNNQCWGTISVSDSQGYCPMNIDTDVTFPLDEIYLPNSNISSSEYTPENLEANYGFDESEVDVTVHAVAPCVVIGWTYEDEVFNYEDGSYKILRTFTVIDWYTYNPPSTAGIYTHVQTINVGINPNDLICDILPNDAPVGDCSTGHSLEDDVEWPSDLAVSDYRITPEGLIEYSGVAEENASPIFFNTPEEYSTTYIDLLVELTPTTLTVARIWKAVNSTYNLTWNYSQTIVVDFSEFENLVTVHTATNRPIPGVMFNNNYTTNIDGEAQVLEEIVSIDFEDEVRNGLFLDDILLIQRHILGIELLDEDIMWAADVNSNGQITGADIIELRNRITGESQEIEWVFTNTQTEDNSIVQPKAAYLAHKKGDVDDNAIFSIEDEMPITASIIVEDKVLNNGETYMIPIKVENLDLVLGMEIRLELNNDFVEYMDISNNIGFEDLEVIDRGDGEFIIFAVDPNNAQDISTDINNAVVYIECKAKANILLHDAINVTNSTSYAVDENLVLHAVGGKIENMITGTNSPELASVKVFPNPTTDYLRIDHSDVSVKGDFTIEILNTRGQLISRQSNDLVDVHSLSHGLYYYKITIGDYVTKGKFIVIP